jgi:hypothetical protein
MPIKVIMQEESAAQTVSVGEKACPFPLLSVGASVIKDSPEAMCSARVRSCPRYCEIAVGMFLEMVESMLNFDARIRHEAHILFGTF